MRVKETSRLQLTVLSRLHETNNMLKDETAPIAIRGSIYSAAVYISSYFS